MGEGCRLWGFLWAEGPFQHKPMFPEPGRLGCPPGCVCKVLNAVIADS